MLLAMMSHVFMEEVPLVLETLMATRLLLLQTYLHSLDCLALLALNSNFSITLDFDFVKKAAFAPKAAFLV
jgi:hypothetical protein